MADATTVYDAEDLGRHSRAVLEAARRVERVAHRSNQPYVPARRPGGRPPAKPAYRVLVYRHDKGSWDELPTRVGLESAQQFYDHVANTPGMPPAVGRTSVLRGAAGRPLGEGFSRTIHCEISGAGRITYRYHDSFTGGAHGDPHPVVLIRTIDLSSHRVPFDVSVRMRLTAAVVQDALERVRSPEHPERLMAPCIL